MISRSSHRPSIEQLESRQLLAVDLQITEFMARNGATLRDGFGDSSDWIEIHNAGDESVDLMGYHLTDNPRQRDKWTFTEPTPLDPGAYLLVFASGADTRDPNGHWHTNFRLDADGEFLALSNANWEVLSQFGSTQQDYPPQLPDVSFGRGNLGQFVSTDVPQSLPSGQTGEVTSRLVVDGLPGSLVHLSVTLSIQHAWVDDLDVYLVSPTGTRVELFTDVGGSGDHFEQTTLDDRAEISIRDGRAPFTGRFRPEGTLSQLAGEDPNGEWTLDVQDDFAAVGGTLESWSLKIETDQVSQQVQVGYLEFPTPGSANSTALVDYVRETGFSVERGFFDQAFDVELTTSTAEATIYYTIDGSDPGPDNSSAQRYSQPIRIETTTTLRARAVRSGWLDGPIGTQTYLFLEDVVQQPARPDGFPSQWAGRTTISADYEMDPNIRQDPGVGVQLVESLRSLPTVSLVMNTDDWFDSEIGIYSNSEESGDEWERRVSVELFGFTDGRQIQLDAGVRMQGNASRWPNRPKHNLRLAFRDQYGADQLDFPLFDGTSIDQFSSIVLRGGNGDSWINPTVHHRAAYIRDQWHRDVQVAMGHETSLQRYAHLYINGLYWGLFHLFERVDADFMAEHFGGDPDDYDVIKDIRNTGGQVEAVSGTTDAWDELITRVKRDLRDPANYQAVLEYLDVENLIDYLLLNFYSANKDWDRSNWRAGRRRDGGQFQFFCWDSERTDLNTSGSVQDGPVSFDVTGTSNTNYPTYLHQRLRQSEEYRILFADRAQKHLFQGGILTGEQAARLWNARADEIRLAILAESARWGDAHIEPPRTIETWENHLRDMNRVWFPQRTEILLRQLRSRGLYPDLAAPEFEQHGGIIVPGSALQLSFDEAATVYYTLNGSDPRAAGGAIQGLGTTTFLLQQTITLQADTQIRARAWQDNEWSARTDAYFQLARPGDANLDGVFDTADLVQILQFGEYEDTVAGNSVWQDGDWNQDGDFDVHDLVFALQHGAYST